MPTKWAQSRHTHGGCCCQPGFGSGGRSEWAKTKLNKYFFSASASVVRSSSRGDSARNLIIVQLRVARDLCLRGPSEFGESIACHKTMTPTMTLRCPTNENELFILLLLLSIGIVRFEWIRARLISFDDICWISHAATVLIQFYPFRFGGARTHTNISRTLLGALDPTLFDFQFCARTFAAAPANGTRAKWAKLRLRWEDISQCDGCHVRWQFCRRHRWQNNFTPCSMRGVRSNELMRRLVSQNT